MTDETRGRRPAAFAFPPRSIQAKACRESTPARAAFAAGGRSRGGGRGTTTRSRLPAPGWPTWSADLRRRSARRRGRRRSAPANAVDPARPLRRRRRGGATVAERDLGPPASGAGRETRPGAPSGRRTGIAAGVAISPSRSPGGAGLAAVGRRPAPGRTRPPTPAAGGRPSVRRRPAASPAAARRGPRRTATGGPPLRARRGDGPRRRRTRTSGQSAARRRAGLRAPGPVAGDPGLSRVGRCGHGPERLGADTVRRLQFSADLPACAVGIAVQSLTDAPRRPASPSTFRPRSRTAIPEGPSALLKAAEAASAGDRGAVPVDDDLALLRLACR